jgi:hypothetical protein
MKIISAAFVIRSPFFARTRKRNSRKKWRVFGKRGRATPPGIGDV